MERFRLIRGDAVLGVAVGEVEAIILVGVFRDADRQHIQVRQRHLGFLAADVFDLDRFRDAEDGFRVGQHLEAVPARLEFDLPGEALGYAQVLNEIQETGYAGTELGDWGFMPTEPAALRAASSRARPSFAK